MLTGAFLQSTVEYCTKKNKTPQDSRIQDYNLGLKIVHIKFYICKIEMCVFVITIRPLPSV